MFKTVSNYVHMWKYRLYNRLEYSTHVKKVKKRWTTWNSIVKGFLPLGMCLIAVMQLRAYRKLSGERTATAAEARVYRTLPLRTASRLWGWMANKQLPEPFRPVVYGLYTNMFGVNLDEAASDDLKSYKCFSDFFARPLKHGTRFVDLESCVVAPCDGTVLNFGPVQTNHVEQVKGVTYSLEQFLGQNTWSSDNQCHDYRDSLLHESHCHALYHCVIYLSPGDYHRFHSPTDWNPTHRRHFHGELLSVNPLVTKWLPGLFCLNERAVYLGHWKHGFFSFTAIGATNVGNIKVYVDKTLQTNRRGKKHRSRDKCLGGAVSLKKGDPFGEFRMGSTIVLVFEAPPEFHFNIAVGQKVKMGQSIGCSSENAATQRVPNGKDSGTSGVG